QPQGATITNTNPAPLIGISDCAATVNAGGDATFVVRTSGATQLPATVHYTTVDDSTTANDYDHLDGDLSIPAGQSAANIVVHTKAKPPDRHRSFHVQLSNPQNVTFLSPSASSANCTIHQGGTGGGGSKLGSGLTLRPRALVEPDRAA